jgi:hypothetical protein
MSVEAEKNHEKPQVFGVRDEIRTEHLPNKNLRTLDNFLGKTLLN